MNAEDIPPDVVEAAATGLLHQVATGAKLTLDSSGDPEWFRRQAIAVITAALGEYEKRGCHLICDDEATVRQMAWAIQKVWLRGPSPIFYDDLVRAALTAMQGDDDSDDGPHRDYGLTDEDYRGQMW